MKFASSHQSHGTGEGGGAHTSRTVPEETSQNLSVSVHSFNLYTLMLLIKSSWWTWLVYTLYLNASNNNRRFKQSDRVWIEWQLEWQRHYKTTENRFPEILHVNIKFFRPLTCHQTLGPHHIVPWIFKNNVHSWFKVNILHCAGIVRNLRQKQNSLARKPSYDARSRPFVVLICSRHTGET